MSENILIVDDEKEITDLIALYLQNENYTVFKCYTAREAMEYIETEELDLAILDIMLPEINGFTICQKIREKHIYPIIMLTAKDSESDKITGLTLGADDYVTKPFRPLELVARVKAQLRRYKKYIQTQTEYVPSPVLTFDKLLLNPQTYECFLDANAVDLTPTEFAILRILLEHKGEVVSLEDMFHSIWKDEYYNKNSSTITVHIRHLREKLKDTGSKPRYLNEIVSATQIVYEQNDQIIKLSEPLRDVENKMNQIKMSMLLNQKAVKEAEDRKQELVMYLAHDIRTPLTTVIGYLSLLQEAPDMPVDQKAKYIGIALEKAERLETLLNELFEITRYNMQTVILKKSSFDLHTLLNQIIDEFYPALTEHGNSIDFSMEKDLLLNADPEKLARVFNNLLKNAVAYSFPNTAISVSAHKVGNNILVTFQNQGHTISENQISSIFEKFSRLDDSRASNTGGSGLGLSIAKEIILLHGGQISAHSENETITFTVQLPVSS